MEVGLPQLSAFHGSNRPDGGKTTLKRVQRGGFEGGTILGNNKRCAQLVCLGEGKKKRHREKRKTEKQKTREEGEM